MHVGLEKPPNVCREMCWGGAGGAPVWRLWQVSWGPDEGGGGGGRNLATTQTWGGGRVRGQGWAWGSAGGT